MTAFPQIVRCALAQWRGLTERERIRLNAYWAVDPLSVPAIPFSRIASQVTTPIWWLRRHDRELDLISIKTHHFGDVP